MAGKYTEAQKRASLNYQKDKAQIKITVSKDQREAFKNHAETKGIDLTKLIISLIEKDMNNGLE